MDDRGEAKSFRVRNAAKKKGVTSEYGNGKGFFSSYN